jgi:hypothetical protein
MHLDARTTPARDEVYVNSNPIVMAGLDPAIHGTAGTFDMSGS